MAKIDWVPGKTLKPGTGILAPYPGYLYPRSFLTDETLEIDWEHVTEYMEQWQKYHREMRKIKRAQGIIE